MNILVTGAAGFLGSHLCEALLSQNHYVIGVDNLCTGLEKNMASFCKNKNFEFIKHDIQKPLKIKGNFGYLYHLACPASPRDYQKLPLETLLVSSMGTWNMLKLGQEKKARFLFSSTSEIYGDPDVHPQTESYWGKVNPIGPRSCYDEGKRFAESLIINWGLKRHLDVRIARIFNTYGPRMRKKDGRVIPNFIRQAIKNEPLTVYGNGQQTRSFCYVDDMIKGIIGLMEAPKIQSPINLGNPQEITMHFLAKTIIRLTNSTSKITYLPLPKDDPIRRCPDITKARQLIKFKPVKTLEGGLRKTIDFLSEN